MDVRQIRGYSILAKGDTPIMVNEEEFLVPSQSSSQKYKVTHLDGWSCECKDFKYRKQICKHIHAIQFWLKVREGIGSNELMELESNAQEDNRCVYCNSEDIVKNGNRKTKSGIRQRYLCKDCKKRFIIEPIKHVKGNSKIVTLTMDLYFKGLSLRDISDTIYQFYGLKLHHETIRRWIIKFTEKMNNYVNKLRPTISDAWHVDEQNIKVKGKWLWSWNLLDEETRFLIANTITEKRETEDARLVLQKAKEIAKVKPGFIITDGLHAYEKAISKEFITHPRRKNNVKHVRLETIKKRPNNNLIERYHSTFREFDKVRRGFKLNKTAQILTDGFRTYYNFVRRHQTLKQPPSVVANINIPLGRNRWLGLLKKSLDNRSVANGN